ncbi:MAG: hypothetical protein IJV29_00280 [Butyrivibrio sp.]|nr:hypothetical protein [Butyrivibrio sp.]
MSKLILDSAYNNFLSTYMSTDVTKADTHKKSELKNVRQNIAKLNKESPLYLLTNDTNAQAEAVGVKEYARKLQGHIINMKGETETSPLSRKSAFTSDPDSVEANYIGSNDPDYEPTSFEISVSQLADRQINVGSYLNSDSKVSLPEGTYSFDIRTGNQDYEFQYSINKNDSNLELQNKIARLINKANIGLVAGISEDANKTAIEIQSAQTGLPMGQNQQFDISEVDSSNSNKGTVNYLGLNNIMQNATNAHFTLNGTERVSIANHFTVSNEYEILLKNISDNQIQVGVKTDGESLSDRIHALTDSYNDFITNASAIDDSTFNSKRLISEIRSLALHDLGALEAKGLSIDEKARIIIDNDKVSQLASEGRSDEIINPLNKFSDTLIDKTKAISIDPMKYVDRPVVNYKNPDSNDTPSPYITSEYSGMMFNYYC